MSPNRNPRCPRCDRIGTIRLWRELDSFNPGDVISRAVCIAPDCTYEC